MPSRLGHIFIGNDLFNQMTLSAAQLGFVRALGVSLLIALLKFLGDSANLNGVVSGSLALLIPAIALSFEHALEAKNGSALFGAVQKRLV